VKIVSWNLEGRLSDLATNDRGTPEKIVAALKTLDADISVHPEAFGEGKPVRPEITQSLRDAGYAWQSVDYDDQIDRGEKAMVQRPHMMILSRLPIKRFEIIRPGNLRNMLTVYVDDSATGREVRVIGVHLEDREEQMRLKQGGPTIVCGDFNAMPPNTPKSGLIHSGLFRAPAALIPHKHIRYTLQRLSAMASGTTIATILKSTELHNTDPQLRATTTPKMRQMEWMPSIRFAKIDWMFVSPGITYDDFHISADLGSDHRALSIHISLETYYN
jgi:endonuclease/exonuclease/phosphatase family metal-dependent hydrolase